MSSSSLLRKLHIAEGIQNSRIGLVLISLAFEKEKSDVAEERNQESKEEGEFLKEPYGEEGYRKYGKIPKLFDFSLYPIHAVQLWISERDEVCDQLKHSLVEETFNEEREFINWMVEHISSYEEIGFVPIIHDLGCHFPNFCYKKLSQEERNLEKETLRKKKRKSKRTNSSTETHSFPPLSGQRSNSMRFIVRRDVSTSGMRDVSNRMKKAHLVQTKSRPMNLNTSILYGRLEESVAEPLNGKGK
jgi:hypothetical protein